MPGTSAVTAPSPRAVLAAALPAIVLATLALAPFLGKAFTIDDTFFLRGAQQAIVDPLHPTAFDIVWFDVPERAGPAFGPLVSWLLVPAVLSGHPEVVAHLIVLALLWIALLATASLALRLRVPPILAMGASLLLAATPTVLGMAGTAMGDVPAMALGIAGLERLVAWSEDRRWGQAIAATIFLGLAPLARPHAILLLGVGGLLVIGNIWTLAAWQRLGQKVVVPLVAALALTVALLYVIRDSSAGAPGIFGTTNRLSSLGSIAPNLTAFFTHWVVAYPLALVWLGLRPAHLIRRWWVMLIGCAGAYFLLVSADRTSAVHAVLAGLGFAVLWDIIADAVKRRDEIQMSLGASLFAPLIALPYSHFPLKLNLLAAPAACIIVVRAMAMLPKLRTRLVLGTVAAAGVTLGVAILRADSSFAELGRRAASELIVPRLAAGDRVWFMGHWGFQWYAEQAGAKHVTLTPPYPEPGDFVVICRICDKGFKVGPMLFQDYGLVQVAELSDRAPGGRLMTEGAGFFSNNNGYLPWTWGVTPLEEFVTARVIASRWSTTRLPQ
jgi:hypothetical protein